MRSRPWIFLLAVLLSISTAVVPASAEDSTENAIVSEGNGAAVFIGYGGDRSVTLSWRPSKRYENSVMLYQVQRGDGPMLESKTRATSFIDRNLQPNTFYTYELTVFLQTIKTTIVRGERVKKATITKVGANSIRVLTLPSMVVNLRQKISRNSDASCTGNVILAWELPEHAANPLKFSVKLDGNVMAYGVSQTQLGYTLSDLPAGRSAQSTCVWSESYTIEIVAENQTGPAKVNARLTGVRL